MNKKNLALLISKHPLLRKLTEDKTIPNSVVARLIVEEMGIEEAAADSKTASAKSNLNTTLQKINNSDSSTEEKIKAIQDFINKLKHNPGAFWSKYDTKEDEQKEIYNKYVTGNTIPKAEGFLKILTQLQTANPENAPEKIEQAEEKIEKEIEATLEQEVETEEAVVNKIEQSTQTSPKELVGTITSTIVDIGKQQDYISNYQENPTAAMDFIIANTPEEQVDVLKTAPPEAQQQVVQAVAAELEKDQQENPFKELQGYSELKLKPPEEKVFVQFLTKLQEAEIINEENLVQLSKIVGTGRGLSKIIKNFGGPERKILITVLQRVEVQKFIQNNLQQIEKPQEPGKEEKPSTPMKGEPVAIDPEQTGTFVAAANELLNDFYNQKYRKNQAIIVGKVINSMKAFVEDADLALAFGKPPADKPEEQEATSEEPAPLEEQEEQEVKADKDEMRNIRIGLRSFLSRVNKTNKYLTEFEKVAGDGSVLSDAYKKKFMDNLKEIQTAIYRLALVLNKMLDSKEELNEKKGSETINKWKEVQKLYDLSIKSVSSVKELLDTETPPDELDSTLTNDAYTALIDLAGHFPSVAPFGAGKMKRSDFGEYKTKFANAIGQLKSDLQNVFNLIKTGEAGEESLQNARGGLRDFGDAIASIFGVPSRFKDAKVKPGDDKAPAVQEDPEAEKEPEEEEEKYSDEISEEDRKLLSLALKQDKDFYQKALKIIKSSQDPSSGSIQLEEVVKKTEDLIGELESIKTMAKQQIKRMKDGKVDPGSMEKLVETLREYVSLYEKIQDSIRSGDMSSILDTNPVRVEKVQKLIDRSKRYLDEKAAMNNLFVAVINDAFGDNKNLELIWDALKDADGKEAAQLTSDMKGKIARAGKNIKNTILKSFEPEKLDFSSFKKFVGMVADKISKTAIQLDKKINEEKDIEIPATQDDIKRAEKEKADERDAPFKEKELKTYQKNFGTALQEMKSFVALYNAFDYAMDQIEKEVGRTKFLEAFDKEYSTVLAQLGIMDDHLKKVAKMFGEGTPSLTVAEKYGFPPDDFILPDPEKEGESSDDILDIPQPDQEEIVDIINLNVGKMDNSADFWNKPLKDKVDLVLDMPDIKKFKVKYFDPNPIEKNKEDYEKLIDKVKDEKEEDTPEKSTYETIMSSKVPESLGFSAFPEEEEVLKLFKWYQATNKPISEKLGQTISNRISEKHPKLQRTITSFVDDFLKEYHPKKIKIWSEIMSRTSAMDKKKSAAFVNYLLNPIDSKHNPTQKNKKANKEGYVRLNRKLTEQVLANKLKPLIREMLTKGK
jgi:hypothetical protein